MGKPTHQRFDQLDVSILNLLSDDGRRPFTQVARELGVTEATIRARVGRLARSGAIRFVTEIDPHELGLLSAFLLLRITSRDTERAVKVVCDIPEAIYVLPCVGTADIIVQIACADPDDLNRIIAEHLRGSGLEVVQTLVTLSMAKVRYSFASVDDGSGDAERDTDPV